ncbi:hypothetical protein I8751_14720 [Nostocaceae cyanobacterium CENA357]|uniref:Uncharacterized protein n=1 Tax=Atlanticothrix silvestris CENA357 TaxID=1725252 RepID=A0A8J7L3A6_9CYAN|nr:hypothetical protein [Atlanticothrix silvestris]MBH8553601.1 hypothetical protein [Atlanticothrix silvestris CENA357]
MAISVGDLASRAIRKQFSNRTINPIETSIGNSGGGNIISIIVGGFNSLKGFVVEVFNVIGALDWKQLWAIVTQTVNYIWNFNWNATDTQLEEQIRQRFVALSATAGGTLGNAFGYLACGVLPGALIMTINEPMGAYVLANVVDEAADEFLQNFATLINQTFSLGVQITFAWLFKNVRKLIKSNSPAIGRLFGRSIEKAIKSWGEKGSQPWSFAIAFDNAVESIPNEALRNFVEEFAEEAIEACVEAGYVVANSVDTYLANKVLEKQLLPPNGGQKYVEITPNRDLPDETIVIGGQAELLKPVIVQTLAQHQVLGERDLGTIYGTPPEAFPERRYKPELVLKFYQERKDRVAGEKPITMQISMRLMNKSKDDFASDAYVKQLAEKVHQRFARPPFKVTKGNKPYSYADWEKGYQMLLWVDGLAQARRIVEQVLDIQGHSVDNSKLKKASVNAQTDSISTIPEKVTIMGKREKLLVQGKPGVVTFRSAYINVGLAGIKPITLIDLGKRKQQIYQENTKTDGTKS